MLLSVGWAFLPVGAPSDENPTQMGAPVGQECPTYEDNENEAKRKGDPPKHGCIAFFVFEVCVSKRLSWLRLE